MVAHKLTSAAVSKDTLDKLKKIKARTRRPLHQIIEILANREMIESTIHKAPERPADRITEHEKAYQKAYKRAMRTGDKSHMDKFYAQHGRKKPGPKPKTGN